MFSAHTKTSSFLTCRVYTYMSNHTTCAICGAGSANHSGANKITPSLWWGSCCSVFGFPCCFFYTVLCILIVFTVEPWPFVVCNFVLMFPVDSFLVHNHTNIWICILLKGDLKLVFLNHINSKLFNMSCLCDLITIFLQLDGTDVRNKTMVKP